MTRKEYQSLRGELLSAHKEYVDDVVVQMTELGIDELDYDGSNCTLYLDKCNCLHRGDVNLSMTKDVSQIVVFARLVPDINSALNRWREAMAKSINDAIFSLQN